MTDEMVVAICTITNHWLLVQIYHISDIGNLSKIIMIISMVDTINKTIK